MSKPELIFIYNAGSGLFSSVTDFAHKILSPSTYQCNLCALTYGNFSMRAEWKLFIENLSVKTVFLHKDEFLKEYKTGTAFPAIFLSADGHTEELVSKKEIENCRSLEELKKIVSDKFAQHDQHHHTHL